MPNLKNNAKSVLALATRIFIITGVLIFAGESFSQEMRKDVPGVIKPSDKVEISPYTSIRESFVRFYDSQEKPSMTIFWNKKFSDKLQTEYEEYVKFKSVAVSGGLYTQYLKFKSAEISEAAYEDYLRYNSSAAYAEYLRYKSSEITASAFEAYMSVTAAEATSGDQAIREGGRPQLIEQIDWAVEGPFTDELLTSGVILVDRAMIMRTLKKGDSFGHNPDVQSVEITALLGKVDWLVEVLVTDKLNVSSNLVFRISVTDVESGRIISSFTTEAIPWQPTSKAYEFVATSNGFQKVQIASPPVTYEEVGEKLAIDFMAALLRTQ